MQKLLLLVAFVLMGCNAPTNTAPKAFVTVGTASGGSTGTLSGVAAVGTPIVGGNVAAVCASGSQLTATTGSWTATLSGQTLPCALAVSGGTINGAANTTSYHSIAIAAGTVNITPLTDLLVANMAGQNPNAWFAGLGATSSTLTAYNQTAISTALSSLSGSLTGLKQLNSTNPVTTSFTPTSGNVSDDLLTALSTAETNTGVTHATLINNMSSGTIPAAALNTSLTSAYAATTSGSATYSISITVSGLTGTGLVLQDNGTDNLTISATGSSTFATKIATGSTYSVTVSTQPTGQTCYATSGSGTVSNANVTGVNVICSAGTLSSYSVGVTVSGLTGSGLVLQDNSADNLAVTSNGAKTFATQLISGATYSISVSTQPSGQTCAVANGSGMVSGTVSSPTVTCSSTALKSYSVSVTTSGLSGTVVLQNNLGDNLSISTNSSTNFATQLVSGSSYSISVLTQPTNQSCTVANASGTIASANITSPTVTCTTAVAPTYSVSVTVSGLSGTVILQNNLGDNLSISSNGSTNFATQLVRYSSYSISVLTQPTNQTCTVTYGSGTIGSYNYSNPAVTCTGNPTGYVSEGGLTWMPTTLTWYTWSQATALCTGSTYNGLTGWRLPTQPELSAFYAAYPMPSSVLLNPVLLNLGWALSYTWSSTPNSSGSHYDVNLANGSVFSNFDTSQGYVTCVR
jgi:hypothetical protein